MTQPRSSNSPCRRAPASRHHAARDPAACPARRFPDRSVARGAALLVDKNAALDVWMKRKVERKQVRFYQESTFVFDE